jgi:hypothetical protein
MRNTMHWELEDMSLALDRVIGIMSTSLLLHSAKHIMR